MRVIRILEPGRIAVESLPEPGRGLYPEALGLIAAGRLISHRFAAVEAARAFATAGRRRDIVTRAVLNMTAW